MGKNGNNRKMHFYNPGRHFSRRSGDMICRYRFCGYKRLLQEGRGTHWVRDFVILVPQNGDWLHGLLADTRPEVCHIHKTDPVCPNKVRQVVLFRPVSGQKWQTIKSKQLGPNTTKIYCGIRSNRIIPLPSAHTSGAMKQKSPSWMQGSPIVAMVPKSPFRVGGSGG